MNKETFERIYLELEKPLYNTVYRWVWREDEALDIVQEAFVRLWSKRHDVIEDQVRPYVFKIALNLAANHWRRNKLWKMSGLDGLFSSFKGGEQQMVENERRRMVRQAVELLPHKIRSVVMLVRFADMSYRQIAEMLNIPEGTVGSRYTKGCRILEARLSKDWSQP